MGQVKAIAAGDFDNDGDTDVVTGMTGDTSNSQGLHIHEQLDRYRFSPDLHYYTTSVVPTAIEVYDFNEDGKLDIVSLTSPSSLGYRKGNGDLSFQTARYLWAGGGRPYDVAIADFNNDGHMDIIAPTANRYIVTFINDGAGNFSSAKKTQIGATCLGVTVGDFDEDGTPDMAAVYTGGDRVYWATGKGDGYFNSDSYVYTGDQPRAVCTGDFDGDGHLDLALPCEFDDCVTLLYGNGAASFGSRQDIPVPGDPYDAVAGDFNGDGVCDFAVARKDLKAGQATSVFLSNGDRTYEREDYWGEGPISLYVADVWGGGLPDILVAMGGSTNFQVLDNRTYRSTSPVGWLSAGWNLMSLPLDPIVADAASVLSDVAAAGNTLTNNLFRYSKLTGYEIYPAGFGLMELGRAYWLYLSVGCRNTMVGVKSLWTEQLPLEDGWNMIGCPQDGVVALSACEVTDGTTTYSIPDAEAAGWIQALMYYYDGGVYRTAAPSGADDDSLRPWYGYWLLTYRPGLSLVVPQP